MKPYTTTHLIHNGECKIFVTISDDKILDIYTSANYDIILINWESGIIHDLSKEWILSNIDGYLHCPKSEGIYMEILLLLVYYGYIVSKKRRNIGEIPIDKIDDLIDLVDNNFCMCY